MDAAVIDIFDQALAGPAMIDGLGWRVQDRQGRSELMPLARWHSSLSAADETVVARCQGATIDLGCGPGRFAAALSDRGVHCLGIDVSPEAVRAARRAGAVAICQSIFGALPDEGLWDTALLADGNIGIGGDPVHLLERTAALVAAPGRAIVELDAPGRPSGARQLRLQSPEGRVSRWFWWATITPVDLAAVATPAGWSVQEQWHEDGRYFAALGGHR